ncbi:MAG: glycosyltransferase family 2 protein [Ignavibacteriales bacterium]|nr:glycosyltransferase family 2 protein [Ignavibacteriales bacterium]
MISIVIPLYNEQETIPELHRRLTDAMKKVGDDYEIIFVNDNSKDNSFEVMKKFSQQDSHLKVIDLARNFGHQVAISAGIDSANGDAVILMDGDLQDPPELLPEMIAKWKSGFEVVYTMKKSRKENALKRFAFHSFYELMQRFSSIPIPMEAGNFSLMDRKVVSVLQTMQERNRYLAGMRAWIGFRQTGIWFDREARFAGKPQMTISRLINFALDGLFSFSNAPLRLATYVGFGSAFVAFLGMLYVLYAKLFTNTALIGWASTILSILFIGGMILLTLGIIGEYVGRIYDEVKQRPLYVVREKIGFEKSRERVAGSIE